MNKFLKALLISSALYVSHMLMILLVSFFYQEHGVVKYGIIGAAVYILLVAFWVYYLLILVYLLISRSMGIRSKILVATMAMLIGYLASRGGDIIDGEFIKNFNAIVLAGFIVSAFLVVWFDQILRRWKEKTNS